VAGRLRSKRLVALARHVFWLRWRLFKNGTRAASRRDGIERFSRFSSALGTGCLVLLLTPLYLGLAGGSVFLGIHASDPAAWPPGAAIVPRIALVIAVGIFVFKPLAAASVGAVPNYRRFQLLPVAGRELHATEFLTELLDPWLFALALAVFGLSAGMAIGGEPLIALRTAAAGLALLLALATLTALARSLLQLLLRDRRRREAAMLLFLLVSAVGYFFFFLPDEAEDPSPPAAVEESVEMKSEPVERPSAARRFVEGTSTRHWQLLWGLNPIGELYTQALMGPRANRLGGWLEVFGLLALAAGLFELSAHAHRRLLTDVAAGRSAAGVGTPLVRARLPGLSPAASAVAWAQIRWVLRTVTGKSLLLQAPFMTLFFGILASRWPAIETYGVPRELPLFTVVVTWSLLASLTLLVNQFAIDREGLKLQCLLPLSSRELLYGKAGAWAIFTALAYALNLPIAFLLLGSSPERMFWSLALSLVAMVSAFAIYAPLLAILALVLPKKADITRWGQDAQPHWLASLLGMLVMSSSLSVPALLVLSALAAWKSPLAALGLLVFWALAAILAGRLFWAVAEKAWETRRENVLLTAAKA